MSETTIPTPSEDLEEAAQGHELFRAPGEERHLEQARDQAEASGWLDPDEVYEWPSVDEHRRIVNRRRDLYDVMQRLESATARPSGQDDWEEQVEEALVALDRALDRHTREIEAGGGLFDEVVLRSPNLGAVVDDLRSEHATMSEACKTALRLMAGHATVSDVRRHVIDILGQLVVHRQRGAELLYDSYNLDIAAGD